ncbi:Uncharacterised protein [Mycobacteroides abscessus subsp. abscessus]|uniref:DUF6378 domain-containing protein n=1 Tax=Mycobacteroides abscessus TaxID=36809 RepID=UPI00092605DD|nr:DUF6378 domain-containing protein [Mycobacteroides abscessus]SHS99185.1 Uncharacterised protein [Mycobacteroides abscessus subsp. abscessus]SLK64314.1 Uncharacterised protein [Mycobacteroides abscessus subsp. abscessus]
MSETLGNAVADAGTPAEQESILQEAERIINGPRRTDYGPVEESFLDIASRWTVELGAKLNEPLTPFDVSHLMIQLKLSRAKNGFHRDSYVDIGGYAGLTEKLPKSTTGEHLPEPGCCGTEGDPVPRQWQSFLDIPEGVKITDRDGDVWHESDIRWEKSDNNSLDPTRYAPYTEVLDG